MAAGDDKQLTEEKGKTGGKKINEKDKKKMTKEERKKEEEMVGLFARFKTALVHMRLASNHRFLNRIHTFPAYCLKQRMCGF